MKTIIADPENTNPISACETCGRQHQRKQCPFCYREERWQSLEIEKQLPGLFPRLYHQFDKLRDFEHSIIPRSCFCYGVAGTGKTMFALKLLHEQSRNCAVLQLPNQLLFVSVPAMLLEIKKQFSSGKSGAEVIEKYQRADWLVLDDFGGNKDSAWAYEMLYLLIDYRYNMMLPTIVTCNFSLGEQAERFNDDRITRRIAEMCEQLQFKDFRQQIK